MKKETPFFLGGVDFKMKKILAIPNDSLKSYFRSSEEDFLGEFNPLFSGKRIFVPVGVISWGWTAIAERTGLLQRWKLIEGEHNQENPPGVSTINFPVWVEKRLVGFPLRKAD